MSLRITDVMLNVDGIEYKHSLMTMIARINWTLICYYAGMSRFAGIEFALVGYQCKS